MNFCHSVSAFCAIPLCGARIIIYALFFIVPFIGCDKSPLSEDTQYFDDETVIEITEPTDTTDEIETPQYLAESGPTVTRISSVECLRVGTSQGLDDCGRYKYPNYYRINTSPRVVTVILNRPDTVRSIVDASNSFGDAVVISDLQQVGPTTLRFNISASKDTLQTKTVQIGIVSGIPLGKSNPQSVYPTMKFKMKCVGELTDELGFKHLYGTSKWMELYQARLNNRTITTPTPIRITENYIPQFGDVLLWSDGHTGTITTQPTSILRNRPRAQGGAQYRQNRFYLSEMNSRCKGEKTIKFVWHKSYDQTTLKSAQATRGYAQFYYRY